MSGFDDIAAVRMTGLKPVAAFLLDRPGTELPVLEQIELKALPAIRIQGIDPMLTDLRSLVGMRVHLQCDDHSRAAQWVDQLMAIGAAHVIQLTEGEVYQWRR